MEGVAKKGGQVVRQGRNWEKRQSLLGGKDVVANVDGKGKGIEGIEFLQINRVNAPSDIGEGRRVGWNLRSLYLDTYLCSVILLSRTTLWEMGLAPLRSFQHPLSSSSSPLHPFSMEILTTRWISFFLFCHLWVYLLVRERNFVRISTICVNF